MGLNLHHKAAFSVRHKTGLCEAELPASVARTSCPKLAAVTIWQLEHVSTQRKILTRLSAAQVLGGIGTGAGLSVGILLATDVTGSEGWAGVARTAAVVGAAVAAVPLVRIAVRFGRRVSLTAAWTVAGFGAVLLVIAGAMDNVPLLILGMLTSGVATAATMQSRFAATDLAQPSRKSQDLSLVLWASTVGSVLGPNLGAPGTVMAKSLGLPELSGAFVIAAVLLFGAAICTATLRPDPLLLAQQHQSGGKPTVRPKVLSALKIAWSVPSGRLALSALVTAHAVMVCVMTMTPVHLNDHGGSVTLVGITISIHVAGMFAFSPFVGRAADRFGQRPVIGAGLAVLLASTLVSGLGALSHTAVPVGLLLLGLGWSLCMVPASSLVSAAVPESVRTTVQGGSDMLMSSAGAVASAVSGPLLGLIGFGGLNALAAVILLPAAALLLSQLGRSRAGVAR